MATQDTRTTEQQNQQGNQQSQGRELSRSSQAGMSRRGSNDPLAFSLLPSEFFMMNPFSLMRRLTEEIDRSFRGSGSQGGQAEIPWAPAIEINERDGNYVVRAELPGMKPDEVRIEATDNAIVLEGEKRIEREENQDG